MPRFSIKSYRGTEPYAFVSYARADASRVFAEMERLIGAGFNLYYDEGINPGMSWHQELAEAIEGCSVFVFFLTENSMASPNCLREVNFALDREREILAVHLDEVVLPPGLQLALGDRQAIIESHHDRAKYESLLNTSLDALLARSADTPGEIRREISEPPPSGFRRRGIVLLAGLVTSILAGVMWNHANTYREDQLASYSKFKAAIEVDDVMSAYLIGRTLDTDVISDPSFSEEWNEITVSTDVQIDTAEAQVWFRPYTHSDTPWIKIGDSPLADPAVLPKGVIALRVEKPGFEPGVFAVHVPGPVAVPHGESGWRPDRIGIELQSAGELGDQMVAVPDTEIPIWVSGWTQTVEGDYSNAIPAFAIARNEVSNAEFQEFVDAGGYREPGYWAGLNFELNGEPIPLGKALELFIDRTGVAGPAGWSLGHYPEGERSWPVTGISWHEAVAYARFRGMTLPTIHHWARYALGPWEGEAHLGPTIASTSNYDREGILPIGEQRGLGPWGTNDTGGNVREWVWNKGDGQHMAMGGSWSDYRTEIGSAVTVDGMSRNEFTGLRLMQLLGNAQVKPELLAPIELSFKIDLSNRTPVSDEEFEIFRYQYSGINRTASRVEITEIESSDAWILEQHALSYGDHAPFRIFVMRPRLHLPVYQAVVYGPHGGAYSPGRKPEHVRAIMGHAEKAVLTGRWVFMPEWYLSMGRYEPYSPTDDQQVRIQRTRKQAKAWFQDSVDTLNYIDTLNTIDKSKIAWISESHGSSVFGPKLLALQPRYKTAILITAGLQSWFTEPLNDNVNYLPRINQPVLMLNGLFDPVFPHHDSQLPYFNLLGTPAENKRHVLYDDGHFNIPENLASREIASWLDQHLGPVRQ